MCRINWILIAVWLSAAFPSRAQSPTDATIRVPVRLVTAPTLVFSREGRLVSGLKESDFRIFDNGRQQTPKLEMAPAPVSIVLAVQANQDVREYLPFITKAGSLIETLLLGAEGEGAIVKYGDEVATAKPFDRGELQAALGYIAAHGVKARMIDAGLRAMALLKDRPGARARYLIFIGQPADTGSESKLTTLQDQVERENISVFALSLPLVGKAFVSDNVTLEGLSSSADRGGFKAGVDLGKLITVLNRSSKTDQHTDPFSVLTEATGGTQLHFRKRKELENAIATLGIELRSAYLLSYAPTSMDGGYHTIRIEVSIPGAKVHTRPGYWSNPN